MITNEKMTTNNQGGSSTLSGGSAGDVTQGAWKWVIGLFMVIVGVIHEPGRPDYDGAPDNL